jgi:hypothetical protein
MLEVGIGPGRPVLDRAGRPMTSTSRLRLPIE